MQSSVDEACVTRPGGKSPLLGPCHTPHNKLDRAQSCTTYHPTYSLHVPTPTPDQHPYPTACLGPAVLCQNQTLNQLFTPQLVLLRRCCSCPGHLCCNSSCWLCGTAGSSSRQLVSFGLDHQHRAWQIVHTVVAHTAQPHKAHE